MFSLFNQRSSQEQDRAPEPSGLSFSTTRLQTALYGHRGAVYATLEDD